MQTIVEMFEHTVAQYPDHNFILENQGQGYRGMTFAEVHTAVLSLSQGLIEMGKIGQNGCWQTLQPFMPVPSW